MRSFFVTAQAVASDDVVGLRRAHELDEREHRDRVEEVHADDALGVLEVGAHLGDRERRRVRGEDALGRDDPLELGEDLLLHRHLLEDRLEHEVAAREDVPARPARDDASRGSAPCLRRGGRACTRSASSSWIQVIAVVDLLLREVAEHDRDLEAPEEEQRELAGHEAGADDADLLHAPRLGVGHPDTALRAALDEVEGVDGRLRLRAREEVGERVLLGAVALLERPGRSALDEVERAVRRRRRAVHLSVEARARLAADLCDVGEIGRRPSLAGALLDLLEQERERLVEELDRLEERVREAGLERLLRGRACGSGGEGSRR